MSRFNITLFLCFLFVTPVLVFVVWRFWIWFIISGDLQLIEEGLGRSEPVVNPAAEPVATAAEVDKPLSK